MTLAEIETVVRLDLDVTVVVFNDAALGLIDARISPDAYQHVRTATRG